MLPETQVLITTLRCVRSQKSADLKWHFRRCWALSTGKGLPSLRRVVVPFIFGIKHSMDSSLEYSVHYWNPDRGRDFCFCRCVQPAFCFHPTSYPMNKGGWALSSGAKPRTRSQRLTAILLIKKTVMFQMSQEYCFIQGQMLLSRVELCLGLIHTRNFINFVALLFHSEAQVSSKPHLKFLFIHHRKMHLYYKANAIIVV